jgi:hypothetical protein
MDDTLALPSGNIMRKRTINKLTNNPSQTRVLPSRIRQTWLKFRVKQVKRWQRRLKTNPQAKQWSWHLV